MTEFGDKELGKPKSTSEFRETLEGHAKRDLNAEFAKWLDDQGLPSDPGGPAWGVASFMAEPDKAIIVVGTKSEIAGNRQAAKKLQHSIKWSWCNVDVPIVEDVKAKISFRTDTFSSSAVPKRICSLPNG